MNTLLYATSIFGGQILQLSFLTRYVVQRFLLLRLCYYKVIGFIAQQRLKRILSLVEADPKTIYRTKIRRWNGGSKRGWKTPPSFPSPVFLIPTTATACFTVNGNVSGSCHSCFQASTVIKKTFYRYQKKLAFRAKFCQARFVHNMANKSVMVHIVQQQTNFTFYSLKILPQIAKI